MWYPSLTQVVSATQMQRAAVAQLKTGEPQDADWAG